MKHADQLKYVNQLTTEDIKKISQLCLEEEKVYDHHHEASDKTPWILAVMEDRSEFYIYDFELESGYKNNLVSNTLYIKYMCSRFGDAFIDDYAGYLYDYKIQELEQQLYDLKMQKQAKLNELKRP